MSCGRFWFVILILVWSYSAQANTLRMLTEEWAPMSYQEKGDARGYGVDLVKQLADRLELEANIEVLPWARAYAVATSTPDVLLFATSMNE